MTTSWSSWRSTRRLVPLSERHRAGSCDVQPRNWLALSIPFADQTRAQVTWNPDVVESWRIIGYENRITADENFDQASRNSRRYLQARRPLFSMSWNWWTLPSGARY